MEKDPTAEQVLEIKKEGKEAPSRLWSTVRATESRSGRMGAPAQSRIDEGGEEVQCQRRHLRRRSEAVPEHVPWQQAINLKHAASAIRHCEFGLGPFWVPRKPANDSVNPSTTQPSPGTGSPSPAWEVRCRSTSNRSSVAGSTGTLLPASTAERTHAAHQQVPVGLRYPCRR